MIYSVTGFRSCPAIWPIDGCWFSALFFILLHFLSVQFTMKQITAD